MLPKTKSIRFLSLVLKLEIVNVHGIAILDAHLLQTGEQAAFSQLHIEMVPGFIVIEVDVLHQTLQPGTGDEPGIAVVLNLESANKDVARRILDFLSGVAYANDGQIKKVANCTFIITPYNVGLMGDLLDELENNGLYF